VGYDTKGRPVIYSSLVGTKNRSTEKTILHTVCLMEKALHMRHAASGDTLVWVNNLNGMLASDLVSAYSDTRICTGFGFRDLNPRFALDVFGLFLNHYPERLGACAWMTSLSRLPTQVLQQ
jgi:hypothetical protein